MGDTILGMDIRLICNCLETKLEIPSLIQTKLVLNEKLEEGNIMHCSFYRMCVNFRIISFKTSMISVYIYIHVYIQL